MPDPVFTLERLNWRPCGPGWVRRPGSVPVRTFPDRAAAEAARREAEWDLRRRVNPFRCGLGVVSYQTRFGPDRLHDWLLDAGLDPPPAAPDPAPWAAWWDEHHPHFTDAQRAAAWEALDQVRFFRVVERPGPATVHVIGGTSAQTDPVAGHEVRYVGVLVEAVVGTAKAAAAECRRRDEERLQAIAPEYRIHYRQPSWRPADRDPFDPAAREAADVLAFDLDYFGGWDRFAESREVPFHAARLPRAGDRVFIVQELAWRLLDPDGPDWRWFPTETDTVGRPVAVFPDPGAARAWARQLDREAHELPSPFRFGPPDEWCRLDPRTVYGVLSDFGPIPFTGLWSDYRAGPSDWVRWWDDLLPRLTDADLEMAWSHFDRLQFHVVVPAVYQG